MPCRTLQSVTLYHSGELVDALTALRAASHGALPCDGGYASATLTGLSAIQQERWSAECVALMFAWLSDAECTLATRWVPSLGLQLLRPVPPLTTTLERCALFANASLTELSVEY